MNYPLKRPYEGLCILSGPWRHWGPGGGVDYYWVIFIYFKMVWDEAAWTARLRAFNLVTQEEERKQPNLTTAVALSPECTLKPYRNLHNIISPACQCRC